MNAVAEPSNKRVFDATLEFLEQVEKLKFRNGKTSIEISEEVQLDTQKIAFPIRSFSPFYEIFKTIIQWLLEAGICPHRLGRLFMKVQGKGKMFDEEIPALVLSMDDLGIGFGACLIPLAFGVAVFILETTYPKANQVFGENLAHFFFNSFFEVTKPGI